MDDFTSLPHRSAYAAVVALARRQIPADYTTLSEEMAAEGAMGAGKALRYLAKVGLVVPISAFATQYAPSWAIVSALDEQTPMPLRDLELESRPPLTVEEFEALAKTEGCACRR